jgi:hypothetical protein
MPRARNIKPSIMDNEELADLEPLTRLLFIYLWMLADRDGRLEDRPKRIAAQALAYDRTADVNAMLDDLQRAGFISRYTANGIACIQITNFLKHQTPHGTEKDGSLPCKDGLLTKHTRGKNGYASGPIELVNSCLTVKTQSDNTLIPDSGFLIPDTKKDAGEPAAPKSSQVTFATYLDTCKEAGVKPIPEKHYVRTYCTDAGISNEMRDLAWLRFKFEHLSGRRKTKRYTDWPDVFGHCVKDNWYKFWIINDDGPANWTTSGIGERKSIEAQQARQTEPA